ncbi:MAG: GNAT family N-acetyltransferase [Fimbriimonadales bacterium]|nr:GNAT family N-acetyltransferase [Fimbriimonadales bacterium]
MSQLMMRRSSWDGLPPVPDPPDGCRLREAADPDAEALAELIGSAFPEMHWTAERARRDLLEDPNVAATFVVEDPRGELLATASAQRIPEHEPDGFLHWVASSPRARGMGLGALVSLAVLLRLRELGFRACRLTTDDERLPAIRTYLKLGFRPVVLDETHPGRWREVAERLEDWRGVILDSLG